MAKSKIMQRARSRFRKQMGLEVGVPLDAYWKERFNVWYWFQEESKLKGTNADEIWLDDLEDDEDNMHCTNATIPIGTAVGTPYKVDWIYNQYFANMAVEQKQEKEPTVNTYSIEQQTLDYLLGRLANLSQEKNYALEGLYGCRDDDPPEDHEEFAQRIKDGRFTIQEKSKNHYWSAYEALRWRDPDVKEDHDGRNAARELVKKAYHAAKDIIMVKTADEGLEAIQAFEKEDFGPKALKKSKS